VDSIIGYLGDGLSSSTATDPQTVLGPSTTVDVNAGSSASNSTGGVHEIGGNTIALQGSGTADAPHIVIHLDTTGRRNVTISYTLKELDSTTVDQKFALQYRIGESGDFTNVSNGAVSGLFNTSGNQTRDVSVTLPSAVNDVAKVQVRIITNDAPGSDAMIGIDNIVVTSSPPNSAPAGADKTITVTEDGSYTFAEADFGFTDPNDSPANGLLAVKIATLPSAGALTNNGATLSAGDSVPVANITGGLLVYTPAPNGFGTGYASFTFQVQDDGGTDIGGADLDPSANTLTVDVTAVADTPSVTNATTDEDVQTTSGLVITRNAVDGSEVTHFRINNINNGTLFLNDGTTPISNNSFITAAQGAAGLKFSPNSNFFGTGSFQVQASTSNSSGGLGGSLATATITVNPVADRPSVTNATTDEDTPTSSGLVITPNATDGAEVTHFQITGITNGVLFQSNGTTPISNGDFITVAQGAAGLVFDPAQDFNGTGSFTVQASLSASVAGLGGSTDTATITVDAVNDEPTVALAGDQTIDEDAGAQTVPGFATLDAGPSDEDATQSASGYTVTVTGTTGNLSFSVAPAIGTTGELTYTVDPDTNGTATIEVVGTDDGSGTAPNDNTSQTQTFTIIVTAINDEPSAALAGDVVVAQDSGTFTQAGFATFAPGGGTDEAGQSATGYAVGNDNNGLFSTQPAIAPDGTLTFAPAPGASGTATVSVTVTDDGGTANPGDDDTGDVVTFTITVTAAAVAPPPPPGLAASSAQIVVIGSDAGSAARVRVSDAVTGAAKFDLSPFPGFAGGVAVAVGDFNDDGTDDIVVSTATGAGHVKVFDGVTGAEVRSFFAFEDFGGGVNVAAGDLDGDGFADIVAGTTTGPTHVKAFSGATGQLIRSFFAFEGFGGGVNVAAGDVNGDGRADLAVVAGPGGNGHIKVFDGTTGGLLTSFLGYVNYAGAINLAVGDLTGDGRAEVITTALNGQMGTHVKAVNAAGAEVRSFFAPPGALAQRTDLILPTGRPASVGAANLTGTAAAEILVGSSNNRALVLDGTTGAAINAFAYDPLLGLGVFVDV